MSVPSAGRNRIDSQFSFDEDISSKSSPRHSLSSSRRGSESSSSRCVSPVQEPLDGRIAIAGRMTVSSPDAARSVFEREAFFAGRARAPSDADSIPRGSPGETANERAARLVKEKLARGALTSSPTSPSQPSAPPPSVANSPFLPTRPEGSIDPLVEGLPPLQTGEGPSISAK